MAKAPTKFTLADIDVEELSDAFVTALMARGTSKGDNCCSCHNCSNPPTTIASPTAGRGRR